MNCFLTSAAWKPQNLWDSQLLRADLRLPQKNSWRTPPGGPWQTPEPWCRWCRSPSAHARTHAVPYDLLDGTGPSGRTNTFLTQGVRWHTPIQYPDTTHGTAIYADQLGWFWGSIDRHIWQSHGVFGFGSLWHILAIVICSASMC